MLERNSAKSVEFLMMLRMDMQIGAGRVVAHHHAFAFGLLGINCLHGGKPTLNVEKDLKF